MKKKIKFTKIIPVLVLVALLLSLIPLAGTACSDDDEEPPVAAFTGSPITGPGPLTVQFTDQSTGVIDSWEWDFGDGSETSATQSPSHTYSDDGVYEVSLTVEGPGGTDTETKTDYIAVGSFLADFTANQTTGTFAAGGTATIQFTDQSISAADITAWEWDFGDGETSTEQNPSHVYDGVVNRYDVSLTITAAEVTNTKIKDDYITILAEEWQEMSLELNNPFPQTDPAGEAAEKFKELIENYTADNVSVTIYHQTLYDLYTQFEHLQEGAIDAAIQTPAILQNLDPNLAILTSLRGLVTNADMGREVMVDPDVQAFLVDTFAEHDVRYVGGIEAYLMNGFFSPNTDLTDYADFEGHSYWWGRPGAAAPIEAMFSPNVVYYEQQEAIAQIMAGNIDIATFPPNMAYDYSLYNYFDYCLLTMVYAPNSLCFNLDTWNGMDPELQDLISNVIMPQVQVHVQNMVVNAHKIALKKINEELEAVRVITPEREEQIWEMVEDTQPFKDMEAELDATILAVIDSYRPETPAWAQDELDILDYAGIPTS